MRYLLFCFGAPLLVGGLGLMPHSFSVRWWEVIIGLTLLACLFITTKPKGPRPA